MKCFAFILSILFVLGAQAQEETTQTTTSSDVVTPTAAEPEATEPTPSSGRVEKLEVTGSHIKRIDVEGPSPVLTLDREYLNKTGFNNVGDVLRDTTVASFGGAREASLSGGADTGASTTSLRGFSADRVLVLMDGKRLPTLGGTSKVDLSLIPMAAVERIEVLKDGASALYGSDALGGVINIITKKDYDGASVDLGYTYTDKPGGDRTDVKLSYGKSSSRGNILGVLQYRSNESTNSRDYSYAQPRIEDYSTFGSPGSWKDPTTKWNPGGGADTCPTANQFAAGKTAADGKYCMFDYSPWSQVTPTIKQVSALVSGTYEFNEDLKVFARGIYTNRNVNSRLAPPPDDFRDESSVNGPNTQIDSTTATGWGLTPTGNLDWVRYRLVEEAGPRVSEVISNSYAIQSGLKGYVWDTWEWEFSGNYGVSDTNHEGVSGYANKTILFNTAQANPADFNPFAAPGSKANLNAIPGALYKPLNSIKSSIGTVDFIATGEIGEFGAGPIGLAIGGSSAWQTYEQTTDVVTGSGAQWGGGVSSVGKGQRDFQSIFSEFALNPLKSLELSAAGRFDTYSDFGSTINPRFAFRYKPLEMLMLRASWGTGFRAPSLENLYQAETTGFPFGYDPITDNQIQFEQRTKGSLALREETTETYNIGAILQIFKDLGVGIDYWGANQSNEVSVVGTRDIFRAEQAFGNSYLNTFGVDVQRDGSNNVKTIVTPAVNLASKNVTGVDFNVNYSVNLFSNFNFYTSINHSIILELWIEAFPGLGKENRVGFATPEGSYPYWKNNVTLGLGNGTYDLSFLVRTTGETNANPISQDPASGGKTRDHTELDLRAKYQAPWSGTFSLVVRNLLNADRPQLDTYTSSGYIDTSLYDPFGRSIGLSYRHDF